MQHPLRTRTSLRSAFKGYFSIIQSHRFILTKTAEGLPKIKYLSNLFFWPQGKGTMLTFFLNGREGFKKPLPDLSKAASLEEHTFK